MTLPYNSPRTELLRFLPASAARILDVGCGGGGFGRTILERRAVELWGVEPHAPSARSARSSGYVHVEAALFHESGWIVESITGVNRSRWPESGTDTWKTRSLSRLTLGRADDFFFVQYVVVALDRMECDPAPRS